MENFQIYFQKMAFLYEKENATEVEYCDKDCDRCKVEDCLYRRKET